MSLWIESHLTLKGHPKLRALATKLKVKRAEACGCLHFLWHWTAMYQPDGDLSKVEDAELKEAADVNVKGDFKALLVECGWMNADGTLRNWEKYTIRMKELEAKAEDRREQVRERVRKYRDKKAVTPEHTPPVTPGNALPSVTGNAPETPCNAPTGQTGPNRPDIQTGPKVGSTGQQAAPGLVPEPGNGNSKDVAYRWTVTANAIRAAQGWGDKAARRMLDWAIPHPAFANAEYAMLCKLLGSIEHTNRMQGRERIGDTVKYAIAACRDARVNDECWAEGKAMYTRQEAEQNPVPDWIKSVLGPSARSDAPKP